MGEQGNPTTEKGYRDPPPTWDGEKPTENWRTKRREILLWAEDTDLPPKRQGVRVFRHLTGQARLIAEPLTDEQLRADDGLQKLIDHFDAIYAGYLAIAQDKDFDLAFFAGVRKQTENFLVDCQRKELEFLRYEAANAGALPHGLKGKILLKHARVDEKHLSRVYTWLNGDRTYTAVKAALTRLDTDSEYLLVNASDSSKALWTHPTETDWAADADEDHWPNWTDEQEDEDYLSPEYDQGVDTEDEGIFWVTPQLLSDPLEEDILENTFATFAQVHRKKLQFRRHRGFPMGNSGKGKGKSDYSGYP
eukprot:340899-Amphidinium_carterae.1